MNHSGRAFYAGLLEALMQVMGSAKGYLRDHGPRVALLATQIGRRMGLSERERSQLLFAAILSDMGMVGLAEDAWENPVPELPPEARARVREHPARSEERVMLIPHLDELGPLVRHHHEWWNGRGYPDGLAGDAIPLGAQILRVADTVGALEEMRPHRPPLHPDEILEIVERGSGVEFGPEVAREYLSLARGGEIPHYDANAFRHKIARSTEHLLPEEVSPLSGEQLLDIVANLIDAKDSYTAGHSRRVATLAAAVARALGLGEKLRTTIWAGGYLHDLGKLSIPLRILSKRDRLSPEEYALVKRHPTEGAAILETIPSLKHLTTCARYHHERWDGDGYPEGLSGDHIPTLARILAVCDAYDAMTSQRSYRDSRGHAEALGELAQGRGIHFGPRETDAFMSLPSGLFHEVRTPPSRSEGAFRRGSSPFRSPGQRRARLGVV